MFTRFLVATFGALGVAAPLVVFQSGWLGDSPVEQPAPHQIALPPEDAARPVLAAESALPKQIDPNACGPAVDAEYLANNQILSYYGNPYVPAMGILGEHEPAELIALVKAHAAKYDALNGARGVRPALHLVYATAQPEPGNEGLYLLYIDRKTARQYIKLACDNGLLVFIDLQIGRSTVREEVEHALLLLDQPHVHLSLDPEFTMPPGEVPGDAIGSMDAAQINEAQQLTQDFLEKQGLPDKMLIVHRFTDGMVTNSELIQDYPRIQLVMDSDGFGPADVKQVKFGWYAAPAEHSGIKLFFRQDPDLMTEQDVVALDPDVIIYQ